MTPLEVMVGHSRLIVIKDYVRYSPSICILGTRYLPVVKGCDSRLLRRSMQMDPRIFSQPLLPL